MTHEGLSDSMNGLDINDDGTHGPEHMSDDQIREHVAEHIDRSEDWENYGDVNPQIHGGRFIRFDRDMWHMIETIDLIEWGLEDMVQNGEEYMFEEYYFEDMDVFEDGDPAKGFTDAMVKIFDALGLDDYQIDVTNPEILERIRYYLADMNQYTGQQYQETYHADYWSALESKGVDVDQFK